MKRRSKKAPKNSYRIIKWFFGFVLLITAGLGTWVLCQYVTNLFYALKSHVALLAGMGVYIVMHLLLWKPIFIHVMGHELTHALWAVLLGGKIKSLLVSKEGGQVTLSKSNFFIALAPYFFPIYTFLILPIYFIAAKPYYPLLEFLVGFTFALHIALTLHSLKERQSDILEVGVFFSYAFIYFMNLVILVIIITIILPEVIKISEFILQIVKLFQSIYYKMRVWLL